MSFKRYALFNAIIMIFVLMCSSIVVVADDIDVSIGYADAGSQSSNQYINASENISVQVSQSTLATKPTQSAQPVQPQQPIKSQQPEQSMKSAESAGTHSGKWAIVDTTCDAQLRASGKTVGSMYKAVDNYISDKCY